MGDGAWSVDIITDLRCEAWNWEGRASVHVLGGAWWKSPLCAIFSFC